MDKVDRFPGTAGWVGVLLVALLLQGCSTLDAWTRGKVYRPTPVGDPQAWQALLAQRPDVSAFQVPVGEDEQVTVLQAPAQAGAASRVRVFYLHGTFRHAFQNLPKAAPAQAAGMDVYLPDYRGWGASTPRVPDEVSIHEDAWAAWQAVQQRVAAEGGPPVRWVIYGHSMGSAVAARLARRLAGQQAYCALVLESALTSFADVATESVGWLGHGLAALGSQRMALSEDIGKVDPPVWFIHGTLDKTVPWSLGRKAYELAPEPKHWVALPLGHSNLQQDGSGAYANAWREVAAHCARP